MVEGKHSHISSCHQILPKAKNIRNDEGSKKNFDKIKKKSQGRVSQMAAVKGPNSRRAKADYKMEWKQEVTGLM